MTVQNLRGFIDNAGEGPAETVGGVCEVVYEVVFGKCLRRTCLLFVL